MFCSLTYVRWGLQGVSRTSESLWSEAKESFLCQKFSSHISREPKETNDGRKAEAAVWLPGFDVDGY